MRCGADKDNAEDFLYLRLSDEAQEVFNAWLTDLELNKLRDESDLEIIIEHLGKFRSLMPSLALLFHLIEVADGTTTTEAVSLRSAEKAAAWCDYLESHARRVYGLVADIDQQAALKLSEQIRAGKLNDGFTVRDVYRKNLHLLNSKDLAQAACDELVDAGWLKEKITQPGFQQKEKVEYLINPKIKLRDS